MRQGMLVLLGGLLAQACATEEEVIFSIPTYRYEPPPGPPERPACSAELIDRDCPVQFEHDISPLFDVASCSETSCHAPDSFAGNFPLPMDLRGRYETLLAYTSLTLAGTDGNQRYVDPCYPETSKIFCNLDVADGDEHPFVGDDKFFPGVCGTSRMPKPPGSGQPLSAVQLQLIADWIECGAQF